MGIVWAGDGLKVIQVDLDEIRHHGKILKSSPSSDEIRVSKDPTEVREEFKGCDWIFREAGDQVQTFYRWQGGFYEVHHPSLLKAAQVHKNSKEKGIYNLYIKLLLEGLGQQDFTVGLESEGQIIIEDGIQLKGLVTYAPHVVIRAMAPLDKTWRLKGMDVEHLDAYGDVKIEGNSTLNVRTLNLHEGTLINQGTLRFKEDGIFHLHGNNLINDHKIKGIKRLFFEAGGTFHHRTSKAQLKIKKGQFSYEGQEMVFHPDSFMKAQTIQVKTAQKLNTLPRMNGKILDLEASSLEECDFEKVTLFKSLHLLSTKSSLTFTNPLVFAGSLKVEAPCVRNTKGIGSRGSIQFKAPQILNEAFLVSEQGKIILEGNVHHTQGLLGASEGVEIIGEAHVFQGDFHPQSAFLIKSKQGLTYDPEKLKTKNLLKLIFQEPVSFPQGIKTLGSLFLEGPSVEIGKGLEATYTEAQTPFLKMAGDILSTPLKAWGKVEFIAPYAFTAEYPLDVEGDLKVEASRNVSLKGSILGHQDISIVSLSIVSEKEIFAHKTMQVECSGPIFFQDRVVGVQGITLRVGDRIFYKDAGPDITSQTSGLQTGGTLEIISAVPKLCFRSPLSLLGLFVFKGPQAYNLSTLKSQKGFVFLTPFVEEGFGLVNCGKLISEEGNLYVEGNTTHYPQGEIYSSRQAHFKGHLNYFQGPLTIKEHLRIHTLHKWGLSYCPTVFETCPSVTFAFDMGKQLNQPLESPETELTLEGPSITVTKPFTVKEIKGDTPKISFIFQEDFTLTSPIQAKGELLIQAPSVVAKKKIQADQVLIGSTKGDITLEAFVEGTEKVLLNTAENLTYPAEGLQTLGLLHLILPPYRRLEIPLKLLGQLRIEAPDFRNVTTLEARKGIEILTNSHLKNIWKWSLVNIGKIISDEGDIVFQGNVFQGDESEVRTAKSLKIKGHIHHLKGEFVEGQEGLEIEANGPREIITFEPYCLRTLGLLRLVFKTGGDFLCPLEVKGGIEIEVLPHKTPQDLFFCADLIAGQGLRLKVPGHNISIGTTFRPLIKIQSGGSFESIGAKKFSLVHGTVFSNDFFHVQATDQIILGRWLEEERTYKVKRWNFNNPEKGTEIEISYPFYTPNGSSFISNGGMRLETQNLWSECGDILVANGNLEIKASKESLLCGTLIELWQGNASITTPVFEQYSPTTVYTGQDTASSHWINYCLPHKEEPLS